ncbi:MAG: hypothetical protein JSU79_01695 [Dehalococcoidales bacterium]|nr:MAG: hypothetical protein JSU79_01695 [Dehalococcoidales bacterium]
MNKRVIYIIICMSVLLSIFPLLSGCTSQEEPVQEATTQEIQTENSEGFAIYLTKDDIPTEKMAMLSHVEIAEEPIISIEDTISYDAVTHTITITHEAVERIRNLEVPVNGKSFLVCVDKNPIYWGAFWTPISSVSFNGVNIWKIYGEELDIIKLELGYPAESFFQGEDPRNNPEVMTSLKHAGKLINGMSFTFIDELPHSMKGYELYSWREGDEWRFKLITGTNRTKTLQEIVSNTDEISEFVDIRVTGMDALLTLLHKIPDGESVFWSISLRVEDTTGSDVVLEYPDEITGGSIIKHAGESGIELILE